MAEHAYGMLQIFVGLDRMDATAKRAKLRASTTAKFCGRDAIGEWQTALKYRVKSQDLTAHAKWILCKFGSFKRFHDAFEIAVNGWEAASRFVLSTCFDVPAHAPMKRSSPLMDVVRVWFWSGPSAAIMLQLPAFISSALMYATCTSSFNIPVHCAHG